MKRGDGKLSYTTSVSKCDPDYNEQAQPQHGSLPETPGSRSSYHPIDADCDNWPDGFNNVDN